MCLPMKNEERDPCLSESIPADQYSEGLRTIDQDLMVKEERDCQPKTALSKLICTFLLNGGGSSGSLK